jgi:SWI/SNF-related matrix-associated actin-dependent regulator 1 of chromatin subfamily A
MYGQGAIERNSGIKFQILDETRMLIEVSADLRSSNPIFLTAIKEHKAIWDEDKRKWVMPRSQDNAFKDHLKKIIKDYDMNSSIIKDIPEFVLKYFTPLEGELKFKVKSQDDNISRTLGLKIEYNQAQESLRSINDTGVGIYTQLYQFQKDGIEFGIKKYGRLLIGDEMGVGKTIQALGLCAVYKDEWPFLVICPSSLKYNWQREANTWLKYHLKKQEEGKEEQIMEVQVIDKGSDKIGHKVAGVIISYDLAKSKNMISKLMERRFMVIICDEAHSLKTLDSERGKAIIPLVQRAKRSILLTGTPALARPYEIYPLLTCIRPDNFTDHRVFGQRYCQPSICPFSKRVLYKGCDNPYELNSILKTIMIRRLKKDVLSDLPEIIRSVIDVECEGEYVKQIKAIIKEMSRNGVDVKDMINKKVGDSEGQMPALFNVGASEDQGNDSGTKGVSKGSKGSGGGFDAMRMMTELYGLSGLAKVQGVKKFLDEREEYNEKILIFAHHRAVISELCEYAREKKKHYILIDGSTHPKDRGQYVQDFQTKEDIKFAILSIAAASVGLTLTKARTVVFAELCWTPSLLDQAEARVHRIGQEADAVLCYYLLGKDTIDQDMMSILKNKRGVTSKIIDGDQAQTVEYQKDDKSRKGCKIEDHFASKRVADSRVSANSKGPSAVPDFVKKQVENAFLQGYQTTFPVPKTQNSRMSIETKVGALSDAEKKELEELELEFESEIKPSIRVSKESAIENSSKLIPLKDYSNNSNGPLIDYVKLNSDSKSKRVTSSKDAEEYPELEQKKQRKKMNSPSATINDYFSRPVSKQENSNSM